VPTKEFGLGKDKRRKEGLTTISFWGNPKAASPSRPTKKALNISELWFKGKKDFGSLWSARKMQASPSDLRKTWPLRKAAMWGENLHNKSGGEKGERKIRKEGLVRALNLQKERRDFARRVKKPVHLRKGKKKEKGKKKKVP